MTLLLLIILVFSVPAASRSLKEKKAREQVARIRAEAESVRRAREQEKQIARQEAAAEKLRQAEQKRLDQLRKESAREQERRQKEQQKRQQAAQDLPFYEIQLERLYITAEDLRNQYKKALENVHTDAELNRLTDGKAVKDKIINQHITERDHALKKLITAENQIHALEKKRTAAERILTTL